MAVVQGPAQPADQGRDFLQTLGNVPNPGFQDPKGWMPEVSNFAVSLVPAVKESTSIRNSLYMSFAPIAWDKSVTVSMGEAVDVSQIPTGPSPTTGGGTPVVGGSDPNVNGTAGTGGNVSTGGSGGGGPSWHNGYAGAQNGAGGCSVTDVGNDESAGLGGLALMGLGLVVASRRSARKSGRV